MKLSHCLNWKVLLGLLAIILAAYVIFPGAVARFAPLLIFLVCPLSMVLMMTGMKDMNSCAPAAKLDDKKRTYSCPECLLKYEDKAWAEKCLAWCKEHHSCNIEITQHAVSK